MRLTMGQDQLCGFVVNHSGIASLRSFKIHDTPAAAQTHTHTHTHTHLEQHIYPLRPLCLRLLKALRYEPVHHPLLPANRVR